MFCTKCGSENVEHATFCAACGQRLLVAQPRPAYRGLEDDPAMRIVLPVGRSGLAIAAGYAGLFALVVYPGPIALVLGILAVLDLKKHPEKHGMGRAVFAIVAGGAATLVLLALLI
jgi:hypothetical protein